MRILLLSFILISTLITEYEFIKENIEQEQKEMRKHYMLKDKK